MFARTIAVGAAALLFSSVAVAQPAPTPTPTSAASDDVEAQHRRGVELRSQHRDEEARALFQQLWERTHEPRAEARMALAEQELHRYADAEQHLVDALTHRDNAWIQQNGTALQGVLQQSRAAQGISVLVVECAASGAAVFINGASAGAVGRPLRVSPGTVLYEVRASGYTTVRRSAQLAVGAQVQESVTLTANPADHTPPPRDGASAALPGSMTRTLAWVSAGGAVALLGVSALGYGLAIPAANRWNDDTLCLRAGMTREQVCGDDASTARTFNALGVVGLVGGVGLAATSVVLFLNSRSRAATPQAWVCGPTLSNPGATCALRF